MTHELIAELEKLFADYGVPPADAVAAFPTLSRAAA
jgi:hypothetical protein